MIKLITAIIETYKRNKIVKNLSSFFDFSVCEGVILSGSMVYGKNYSIRKDSDIDLLLIVKAENIFKIKKYPFFLSSYYDDHTLELFNKKLAQTFWFDIFVDEVMINVVVLEYEYFKEFCNFEKKHLLRAKLDDTLDIIKERTLRLSDGRIIQDSSNQQKNGTNYIVNYDLYNEGALISRPIFSNIAISRVLYSKTDIIPKLIKCFIGNLKKRFDEKGIVVFFDYIFSKSKPRYRENL